MIYLFSNNKQKGFTLLESMVAIGLIAMAAYMAMNTLVFQNKNRVTRSDQTLLRYVAIQATQIATIQSAFFPMMVMDSSSGPGSIIYVACYDRKGESIKNINNKSGFQSTIQENFKDTKPSGMCPSGSSFEARFFWANSLTGQININILNLNLVNQSKLNAISNFKIFVK